MKRLMIAALIALPVTVAAQQSAKVSPFDLNAPRAGDACTVIVAPIGVETVACGFDDVQRMAASTPSAVVFADGVVRIADLVGADAPLYSKVVAAKAHPMQALANTKSRIARPMSVPTSAARKAGGGQTPLPKGPSSAQNAKQATTLFEKHIVRAMEAIGVFVERVRNASMMTPPAPAAAPMETATIPTAATPAIWEFEGIESPITAQ